MDDQRILTTLDDCSSLAMADKWVEKYEQFKEYMAEHKSYQLLNASLKDWMYEQRFQYRLSSFGEPSTITAHQISLLNAINFPWEMDPPETVDKDKQQEQEQKESPTRQSRRIKALTNQQDKAVTKSSCNSRKTISFEKRIEQLKSFHLLHGHFGIKVSHNRSLSRWLSDMRSHYKTIRNSGGKLNSYRSLTEERRILLEKMGVFDNMPPSRSRAGKTRPLKKRPVVEKSLGTASESSLIHKDKQANESISTGSELSPTIAPRISILNLQTRLDPQKHMYAQNQLLSLALDDTVFGY